MSSTAANQAAAGLSDSQRRALVTLLADEDPEVYAAVRARILQCGLEAVSWLRRQTLVPDPRVRRRATEIIQHLERQEADNRFVGFCLSHGEDLNLEEGLWLLARTRYPEINTGAYSALLDGFAEDLRDRLQGQDTPVGVLATLNEHLFKVLGFRGNHDHYNDPDNCYLNRVIDRRLGNPISLCTVYWLVARRLRLPIVGIGLPGHFLCRYQSSTTAFYIDAFNRGKLLTRTDCVKYLQSAGHGFQEAFLSPTSPGRTLLRFCSNLHQVCTHLRLRDETARMQRYLIALAR